MDGHPQFRRINAQRSEELGSVLKSGKTEIYPRAGSEHMCYAQAVSLGRDGDRQMVYIYILYIYVSSDIYIHIYIWSGGGPGKPIPLGGGSNTEHGTIYIYIHIDYLDPIKVDR